MPVLRPLTPADLDALMVVQREGAQAAMGTIFPQDRFPFPVEVLRQRWERELADPGIDCFVIVDGPGSDVGTVAGFAALRGNEFLHFGTAVSTWGSGLAARAHDEVIALWVARGHRRARLRVFEDNVRARRFYERRGWTATGERSRSSFAPYPVLLTYEVSTRRRWS
jgi:RimJ/RimL family protein N-acetyltransferase